MANIPKDTKTLFDKYVQEMQDTSVITTAGISKDALDALVLGTLKTGSNVEFSTDKEPFIPDESYKTGPWLMHIIPSNKNKGYEKVYVCKDCMTIGIYFFNSNGNICKYCGSKEHSQIVARWINRPWYKRLFQRIPKLNYGHWEPKDA